MPPDDAPQTTQMSAGEFAAGGPSSEPDVLSTPSPTSTPSTASTTTQEVAPPSFMEMVRGMGYTPPQDVQDDYAALTHLVRQASLAERLAAEQRQQDVFTQLGRQLAPRAQELQGFFQGQQQKPAPKAYEPPEFDERWAALVDRDPASGLYVAKRGVDPVIADKANAYAEWTANFIRNPYKMFQPALEEVRAQAVEQARQEFQQMLAQERVRAQVDQIVQQNAGWYYARDNAGNLIPDPINGGYQSSPLGRQYLQTLQALGQAGIRNPTQRDQFARLILGPQIAAASQPSQEQPTDPRQAAAARQRHALAGNRAGNRNALQSLSPVERSETPRASEPDQRGRSMAAQMLEALEAEGVTTKDYFAGID